jgi:hypothetical protein
MGGRDAAAAAPPSEVRRQWIMGGKDGPASPVFPLVKIRIP